MIGSMIPSWALVNMLAERQCASEKDEGDEALLDEQDRVLNMHAAAKSCSLKYKRKLGKTRLQEVTGTPQRASIARAT